MNSLSITNEARQNNKIHVKLPSVCLILRPLFCIIFKEKHNPSVDIYTKHTLAQILMAMCLCAFHFLYLGHGKYCGMCVLNVYIICMYVCVCVYLCERVLGENEMDR